MIFPAPYVFTKDRARIGLHLNLFFISLLRSKDREEFLADESKYLDKYPLTIEQRRCVLERRVGHAEARRQYLSHVQARWNRP